MRFTAAAWVLAAAIAGGAAAAGGAALAQDAGGGGRVESDPGLRKIEKAKRLLKASGWTEQTKASVLAEIQALEDKDLLPDGTAKKVEETANWGDLYNLAVASYVKEVDEDVMDAAIKFYESPDGQKFSKTQPAIVKAGAQATAEFTKSAVKAVAAADLEGKAKGLWEKGKEALKEREIASNETAAMATLRSLASCQAQVQTAGKIDVDQDGIGEYGTFLEMTGTVGVRKNPDWAAKGAVLSPAILSPALANVDAAGIVTKSGYGFVIYLPDTQPVAGFTHERSGGTFVEGPVGTDLAETTWCAYAWPVARGESGNRAFFVNQSGDVMQSANEVAKWGGVERPIPGNSAFRASGITALVAVGTAGMDGDVWKVAD